jgi:hypothetical protein
MRQREKKYNHKAVTVLLSLVLVVFWVSCQTVAEPPKTGVQEESETASRTTDDMRKYYIDSISGDDHNSGTSENSPWKTLAKVSSMTFRPGDRIYFKRGSSYSGCVTIRGDGNADNPITIGAYGSGNAPSFTNADKSDHNGNAMRIRGDYHIVEDLYFHHTAPAPANAWYTGVWASGALHVDLGNDHVIIRNNEFSHNAKAIQSNSQYSLITNNYIHDANELEQEGFLSFPYWGPIGIHLGIGNQEISYNTIENMYTEGGEWGGDGGAIEIDDGRNHKDNIYIHHNQTRHNMGFLEISWSYDIKEMPTSNIVIEYNVSRDYQDFVFWWAEDSQSRISNNTIIRTDFVEGMAEDSVFVLDGQNISISNNIVVIRDDMWNPVFTGDGKDSSVHTNNCYWDIDDGIVNLGVEPGTEEFTADPQFVDFNGGDYHLLPGSPAEGLGALNDGSIKDAEDKDTEEAQRTDFETVEDDEGPREASLAPASETGDWIKLEDTDPLLGLNGGDLWHAYGNSEGTTRTMYEQGHSLTLLFEGSQVRFYGLKSDYMVTANILIDGVLVAENVSCAGDGEFQALLWESEVLEQGVHTVELVSNGDTVEVDFIEYK